LIADKKEDRLAYCEAAMFGQAGALPTRAAASNEVEPPDFVQPLKFGAFVVSGLVILLAKPQRVFSVGD
jgi:hypothetical protein